MSSYDSAGNLLVNVAVGGGGGGGGGSVNIADPTTATQKLKVNADGSINVNPSSSSSSTAIQDGTTSSQKLAVDATGKIGVNNLPGNQRVNAQSGDFLTGSIVDVLSLLTLAGTPTDANTVASIMGRITKIRDLLAGTLTVGGSVTANAGTNLNTSALALETGGNLAAAKTDLDTLVARLPAQGQALKAASLPVVIASDQGAAAWTQVFQTTQTGVASWAGSGDIAVGQYSMLYFSYNVTAISGTSITFKVQRKDAFGNLTSIFTGSAVSTTGAGSTSIGPGLSVQHVPGTTIQIAVALNAITSVSFTVDVQAR